MPAARTIPIRSDRLTMTFSVIETLCDEASPFQRIEIVRSDVFGDVMLLDGHVQLATLDEAAYHESLVRLPALSLDSPRRVLIVGGGDGGALREALRIPGVERADMVEIDERVIALARLHLPSLSAGAFDDPRAHVTIGDAFEFVRASRERYDLIVVDSTDVYEDEEGELSAALWTAEFYRDLRRLLAPGGIVVTQADNPVFCGYSVTAVRRLLGEAFPSVGAYWAMVPSFGGASAFVWGREAGGLRADFPGGDFRYLSPATYALALSPPTFG